VDILVLQLSLLGSVLGRGRLALYLTKLVEGLAAVAELIEHLFMSRR